MIFGDFLMISPMVMLEIWMIWHVLLYLAINADFPEHTVQLPKGVLITSNR